MGPWRQRGSWEFSISRPSSECRRGPQVGQPQGGQARKSRMFVTADTRSLHRQGIGEMLKNGGRGRGVTGHQGSGANSLRSIPRPDIVEAKDRLSPSCPLTSPYCTWTHKNVQTHTHTHTSRRLLATIQFVFKILPYSTWEGGDYRKASTLLPKMGRCSKTEAPALLGGHLGRDAKLNPPLLPELRKNAATNICWLTDGSLLSVELRGS